MHSDSVVEVFPLHTEAAQTSKDCIQMTRTATAAAGTVEDASVLVPVARVGATRLVAIDLKRPREKDKNCAHLRCVPVEFKNNELNAKKQHTTQRTIPENTMRDCVEALHDLFVSR